MRLPGSNLSLPVLVASAVLCAGFSYVAMMLVGFPLGWSPTLAHRPIVIFLMIPYVLVVGLMLRRAWIDSAVFPPVIRGLLALPAALVVIGFLVMNVMPIKSPEFGYNDDSPFATADTLVPQKGWGWPAPSIRVFDEPLESYGEWQYYDFDTSFNVVFVCSLLFAIIFGEAVLVAFWRVVQRRLQTGREAGSGLA